MVTLKHLPHFRSWYLLLPAGLADGGGKHELPPKVVEVDGEEHMGNLKGLRGRMACYLVVSRSKVKLYHRPSFDMRGMCCGGCEGNLDLLHQLLLS